MINDGAGDGPGGLEGTRPARPPGAEEPFPLRTASDRQDLLIKKTLADVRTYDLLDSATFLALGRNPGLIAEEIGAEKQVVIDEIQRLPELLNEVHRLIESRRMRFLLTGSSARRLRAGGVNPHM